MRAGDYDAFGKRPQARLRAPQGKEKAKSRLKVNL
jgi:hypothetical protein